MLPSLADLDTSKLSDEAREALAAAQQIADGVPLDEIAAGAGITLEQLKLRLEKLGAEWRDQSGLVSLPRLAGEEYEALRDSIAAHGQLVPILADADGKVVDGRVRFRICRELELVPRIDYLTRTLDAEELRCLALVVNLARRQVASGARRGLIREDLLRNPSRSDRAIALATGSSHTYVAQIRAELERTGTVATVATRTGVDGVPQRAKTAPPQSRAAPEPPVGQVDVTLRLSPEFAKHLSAGAWADCKAIRLVVVEPGVYVLEVRT